MEACMLTVSLKHFKNDTTSILTSKLNATHFYFWEDIILTGLELTK